MVSSTAETAVRNYLLALQDPASLRDDNLVKDLQQRLENASDRLERVRLRQELENAERPSVEQYENEFVTHAKAWADEQGVGPNAFAEEGVPEGVLRSAGLRRGGRGRPRRRGPGKGTRVTSEQVKAAIPRGTFTIKQLQERSGGSIATVRNVVREAEETGLIKAQGTDPGHQGPGRAPTLYKRMKK